MSDKTFRLLAHRRFWPLFLSQFLGAANDNFFKNALVILVVFGLGRQAGMNPQILATLAAGLFIAPYFLFSALAGQLADKYEKSRLMQWWKAVEIIVAALAAWGLLTQSLGIMLAALFLLGMQSTFTSPIKYAILPEYLAEDELIGGNALIEGGTFLAILLGTIAGGTLILIDHGAQIVSGGLIVLALLGFAAAAFLPRAHGGSPKNPIGWNLWRETAALWSMVQEKRELKLSVLGISWFWLAGAVYLSQFPAFAQSVLGADEHAVTLMLTMFSVGIGIGSVLCGHMLKGEISARYVPFAALGMSVFAIDLYFAANALPAPLGTLMSLSEFLARPGHWRVLFDLLAFAICGGIYIVPLYAILQSHSDEAQRSRVVAANNVANAAFMVAAAAGSAAMLAIGFSVTDVLLTIGCANLIAAFFICGLLPDTLFKTALAGVLRLVYRVEVHGPENLPKQGERAVLAVNHVSFLDPALLAAFLPGRPVYTVNTFIAKLWWVRPFLRLVEAVAVDPANPMTTKSMISLVQEGKSLVIFPEGRLTVTGALMKVYEGPGMIADHAHAPIIPIRIDGAEFTPFSRLKGKLRQRWFPRITITVLPPRCFDAPPQMRGRARRRRIGLDLYDVMSDMMFKTAPTDRTLFSALLDASATQGGGTAIVEDISRIPLSYRRLLLGSLALGRRFARNTESGEAVGILLPNAAGAAVSFFALQSIGRVPAMLNFSTGPANIAAACKAAQIKMVITSRRFIELARLQPLLDVLGTEQRIIFLEDLRDQMGLIDKLRALAALPLARRGQRRIDAGAPAVILFTSGSEGTPKGVVLSHANLTANCAQLAARVAFSPADIIFNALPLFHSFGMTGGLILPLLSGIKCVLYPSPLHYRIVPEMVYDCNATIMFGTDTFLTGYARQANSYDFYSVRHIFAGAEKVRDETRRVWMEKFGLRILEGYGATETAPVLAVNTPMHFQSGSVGRLLPGIQHRLEPVPGIEAGGRLSVSGPNVMLGYVRAENPGVLEKPEQGWYDTGDIVDIDQDGFVRILGRAKRFAKIAGEMISLGQVEKEISALYPSGVHAVVAIPDSRKGEQLVLVADHDQADRAAMSAHFRAAGLTELQVPKTVFTVDKIPLLGTGKVDYPAVKALVEQRQAENK